MRPLTLGSILLLCAGCGSPGSKPSGIRYGRTASFDAKHELKVIVPDGARRVRVWFAVPQDEPSQKISAFQVQSPYPHRIEKDSEGNKVLYVEANDPREKEFTVATTFSIVRAETLADVDASKARPLSEAERAAMKRELEPNEHVIIDDRIRSIAKEVAGGEKNPLVAARKIYDWVLQHVTYWVKDPKNKKASPVGSTEYCLTSKTGNCTDFHSLWTSIARAAGIPTRMVYGSFFKAELNGKDVDQSYHCWPEFYVSGIGWIPHDVAIADIFVDDFKLTQENETLVRRTTADGYTGPEAAKVEYYFGNLEERRVTWSRGRDLWMNPKQEAGPINALPKGYVEVDGKVHPEGKGWVRKLTFLEK
jgi:transglutaminase-like putative cysteine protease